MSKPWLWGATVALSILLAGQAWPARESNVRATKHNFSNAAAGTAIPARPGNTATTVPARTVKATAETQVCVFCHTPHAATAGLTPLWNRQQGSATYTPYTSTSLDALQIDAAVTALDGPAGSSKLCLSCHDGTLAIGSVNVLNGAASPPTVTGLTATMPAGSEAQGYTRKLTGDMTNDHPISLAYTKTLAERDGELRTLGTSQEYPVGSGSLIGVRSTGYRPKLPLEQNSASSASEKGQIQCATCHDPHIRETNEATVGNQKFLRLNRFQAVQPTALHSETNDIICLACHTKGGTSWAYSVHANATVTAGTTYTSGIGTDTRDFPSALPVWKAACLNCHDTHTAQGARRLLRQGVSGGASAIEETCYQCHSAASVVSPAPQDIKADFALLRKMPITGTEVHDIGGKFSNTITQVDASVFTFIDCTGTTNKCGADLIETRGLLANRHVECSDCHNPHRVVKNMDFRGKLASGKVEDGADTKGTHQHTDDSVSIHSNIASGALRGSWGVEPTVYTSASFHSMPTQFAVKRGDPGTSTNATAGASHVTREYQVCLKCHSNYGYADTGNTYPNSATRPQLGGTGGTPANANGHTNFTSYTNQAKEFQAPAGHNVPVGSTSLGIAAGNSKAASNNNNHRSWHPVMAPTGRVDRSGAFIRPWNNSGTGGKAGRLGVQTMYCSDCHGSDTGATAGSPALGTVIPTGSKPWGPHGSSNNFLLKGDASTAAGEGNSNTLCFKCHSQSAYSGGGGTGFSTDKGDGHNVHSDRIDYDMKCNFCHVAVPHGWKNRNLLVNLLDVGEEAGEPAGTAVAYTNNVGYTNGPYYRNAYLRVISFPAPGTQWRESNCNGGNKETMKTNCEKPA